MSNIQYIGARYVPKFYLNPDDNSNDWKSGIAYEPLVVVQYLSESYTSKIPVAASVGDPASNPRYWAKTGAYNAAVHTLEEKYSNLFFNSVSEMQTASLRENDVCYISGFHASNDGGAATFIIVENEDPEQFSILLLNGKYAQLVHNGEINVKQIGAYGDNTHDDTIAFQAAFNLNVKRIIIPEGKYKISNSITIEKPGIIYGYSIYGPECEIRYTGNEYAFEISKLQNANINIGSIVANNGGCIHMSSTDVNVSPYDYVQYINIDFVMMIAATDCIAATTGSGKCWINEIRINNGRFAGGQTGVKINANSLTDELDQWLLTDVGFEGVSVGVSVIGNNTQPVGRIYLNGCRYLESFDYLIQTRGKVQYILVIGLNDVRPTIFDCDDDANNIYVMSPSTQFLAKLSRGYFTNPLNDLQQRNTIRANSDLNDYYYPGHYTPGTAANAATLTNCPINGMFVMDVISATGADVDYQISLGNRSLSINQIITTLDGETTYLRHLYSDAAGNFTFGDWKICNSYQLELQIGAKNARTIANGATSNYERMCLTLDDFVAMNPNVGEFYAYPIIWHNTTQVLVKAMRVLNVLYRVEIVGDSYSYYGTYNSSTNNYSIYRHTDTIVTP